MKPFHRKIKTPAEYEASMKFFSALMDKGGGDCPRTNLMEVPAAPRYRKVAMF